jgi:hypothetical protein
MTDLSPLASLSSALAGIVARTAPAIVAVHSHRSRSTGFVWKSGLIVTANEALADEGEVQIALADGRSVAAAIAGRDHTTDIALLRAELDLAPATLVTTAPALGSLSVVVATDRDAPSAARLAWCRGRTVPGAPCAAATSMRGSSSIVACVPASRAALRSMPAATPTAWRCSDRGACW